MLNATDADLKFIAALRTEGIFKNLQGELIPAQRGTIVIPCADGDRITDVLTKHWSMCNGHQCHHTLALNGGPLLIPAMSPVAKRNEGEILLEHAYGGHCLKTLTTVVLYGHWPCGAAKLANLSLHETLEFCIKAKDRTREFLKKRAIENPSVILCFHVDYADGRKKSYFFHRKAWERWMKDRRYK